jgi:hypothetical protein
MVVLAPKSCAASASSLTDARAVTSSAISWAGAAAGFDQVADTGETQLARRHPDIDAAVTA